MCVFKCLYRVNNVFVSISNQNYLILLIFNYHQFKKKVYLTLLYELSLNY